jgi:hypothetical protein
MPSKILWLSTLVTIAYWFGSVLGCSVTGNNQNYRILEDEPPALETFQGTDQPGASRAPAGDDRIVNSGITFLPDDPLEAPDDSVAQPVVVAQPPPAPAPQVAVVEPATSSPAVAEADADATDEVVLDLPLRPEVEVATAAVAVETEPSLNGLDRSHWVRISTSPDRDESRSLPRYFQDVPLAQMRPHNWAQGPLAGSEAAGWDRANTLSVVVQPLRFLADVVLLPVHMIQSPPRRIESDDPVDTPAEAPSSPLPSTESVVEDRNLADP